MLLRYGLIAAAAFGFGLQTVTAQTSHPTILAELFRNVNCGNCRTPDDQFEAFLAAHPEYPVEKIYFHNEITNPSDPFFLASSASVTKREGANFYAVGSDPSAFIDGFAAGNSEGNWETYVKSAATQTLPAQVTVSATFTGGKYVIHYDVSGATGQNVKVFTLLKESQLVYDNSFAYGNPASGFWNDVFRETLPDPTGSASFALTGTNSGDVTYDPSTHPDWNISNMEVIAVVQTLSSDATAPHAVMGFGVLPLSSAAGVTGAVQPLTPTLQVLGNPMTTGSAFQVELPQSAKVHLTLSDMLGREVANGWEGQLPAGQSTIHEDGIRPLSGQTLSAGSYIARLYVNGVEAAQTKVVYLP